MNSEIKNRLQFVHCNTVFENRDKAIAYVAGDLEAIQRPALYAEPMVLRYGDKENPNIILAIGSKGDGVTASNKNKTFFIDFAYIQDKIEAIQDLNNNHSIDIEKLKVLVAAVIESCGLDENGVYTPVDGDAILSQAQSLKDADLKLSLALQEEIARATEKEETLDKSLTLHVEDTSSINLEVKKDNEGTVLNGNIKLSNYKIVDNRNLPNHIILENDGLYHYVDLEYNEEKAQLDFCVNGQDKSLQLPHETHLIEGVYDSESESIILKLNREVNGSDKIVINVEKLIGEWTVMAEDTDTPVILTKTPVKSEDVLHGADTYQDVLKADVRIAPQEYRPFNILRKTEDNKYLFVDGRADNIKYLKNGKTITVKEALDAVNDTVSNHNGNIIFRKEDGIFANVELEYVPMSNSLRFTKTNKEGDNDVKELKLNNISFLENIYYDSLKEELVIQYKDATGDLKEIRVPVSTLFEEWEVENTNHTVTLVKTPHQTAGKDKLSADVNIASTSDNILRVVNHGLHVRGTSDNIKHGDVTVKDMFDKLNGNNDVNGSIRNLIKNEADERKNADETLQNLIQSETERAEGAEDALDNKILANSNALAEEIARAKAAEESNKNSIESETLRATAEEVRIENKFDTAFGKQSTVNNQITEALKGLNESLKSEVERSTNKDSDLDKAIVEERKRAEGEENRIETAFTSYKENSERQHKELGDRVSEAEKAVKAEADERIKKDQELSDFISDETLRAKEAEGMLRTDLSTLSEKVNTNANDIANINGNVSSLDEKLESEILRAKSAENTIKAEVAQEKASRENQDTVLEGKINANSALIESESKRAIAVEGLLREDIDDNKESIETEKLRATAAEKVNTDAIVALEKKTTVSTNNTGTINLVKTVLENGEGYTLSGSVNVSQEVGNIINSDGSALKATVDLVYDGGKNTLTLKTSNNADKVITLNQGSIVTNITYENATKELVFAYKTADGELKSVRVNVADLFNEVSVENTAENAVTLKMSDKEDGSKVITADVNVSTEPNNLLQKVTGNLYVSNAASGIKFEDGKTLVDKINEISKNIADNKGETDGSVSDLTSDLDSLKEKVAANEKDIVALKEKDSDFDAKFIEINDKISTEKNDRVVSDNALGVRIDGVVSDLTTEAERRENADTSLGQRIGVLETNLPKEVADRTSADNELRNSINTNTEAINNETNTREKEDTALGVRIDSVVKDLEAENKRAIEKEDKLSDSIGKNTEAISNLKQEVLQNKKDATCGVKNTETIALIKEPNASGDGYLLSGDVIVSSAEGNIIGKNGALFASVDLKYNSATNVLTLLSSNNIAKDINLSVGSIVKSISYDSDNKRLVILYLDEKQEEKTIYVPVSDLYNEWSVQNDVNSPLQLNKTENIDGTSTLSVDLRISQNENNLLKNNGGFIEVSNAASSIKFEDGKNLTDKVKEINDSQTELSEKIDSEVKNVSYVTENTDTLTLTKSVEGVNNGFKLSGKVNVSQSEGNIIQASGALFASVKLDYDKATNILSLTTSNGGSYQHKLNVGSTITNITYDSNTIELVIHYTDAEGKTSEKRVDASAFINEWIVEDRDISAIKLTKVNGEKGQPDILQADVKLATPESGNLLQNTNGALYVSNKALDIIMSDKKNVEETIKEFQGKVDNVENTVEEFTEKVTELEKTVNEHTTLIQNNKSDIDSLKIENAQIKVGITEIKTDIDTINGRLDGHDENINDINATIDTIEKNIENLQSKTDIVAEDTSTVDVTFTHTSNSSSIKAEVKVSKEVDNLITVKEDGLHVLEDYDFGTY